MIDADVAQLEERRPEEPGVGGSSPPVGTHIVEEIIERVKFPLIIYPYGSRVYGTASEKSDYDFICVTKISEQRPWLIDKTELAFSFGDVTCYSREAFLHKVIEHEISVLECLWIAPLRNDIGKIDFSLDKQILRKSISEKISHSWVKAKKKLTVGSIDPQLNDKELGLKSFFHAFRICDFAIQIASYGKINNYSSMNELWNEIKNFNGTWEQLNEKYRLWFNALKSDFKKAAPKK